MAFIEVLEVVVLLHVVFNAPVALLVGNPRELNHGVHVRSECLAGYGLTTVRQGGGYYSPACSM